MLLPQDDPNGRERVNIGEFDLNSIVIRLQRQARENFVEGGEDGNGGAGSVAF